MVYKIYQIAQYDILFRWNATTIYWTLIMMDVINKVCSWSYLQFKVIFNFKVENFYFKVDFKV